jgi:hypothetical protein
MRRKRKGAGIKDRLNFLLWLVEHGEEADKALLKSELTLGESVYAHDYLLTPQNRILTIRNEEGKRYRYEGRGLFYRIDSLGRRCVDGKSRYIDGAKRIGFQGNPLKYALNGRKEE